MKLQHSHASQIQSALRIIGPSYMGVSKNRGKNPQIHGILIGFGTINYFHHPFWKGPCFGGLEPQNRGQKGSRYRGFDLRC